MNDSNGGENTSNNNSTDVAFKSKSPIGAIATVTEQDGFELLHSRLQSCGTSNYYFVKDNDSSIQGIPSRDKSKSTLEWTTDVDELWDGPSICVKTLIWEAEIIHTTQTNGSKDDTSNNSVMSSSKKISFVVAIRCQDKVNVNALQSYVRSEFSSRSTTESNDNTPVIFVKMADQSLAEELTGFVSGCMPPICHSTSTPMKLFMDQDLMEELTNRAPVIGMDRISSLSMTEEKKNNEEELKVPMLSIGGGKLGYSLHLSLDEFMKTVGDEVKVCKLRDSSKDTINGSTINSKNNSVKSLESLENNNGNKIGNERKNNMKKASIEDVLTSFSVGVTPSVEGLYDPNIELATRAKIFRTIARKKGMVDSVQTMIKEMGDDFPDMMQTGISEEIDGTIIETDKNALHFASWKGDLESISLLLETGKRYPELENLVNRVSTGMGNYGKSPIFYAITQCRDDAVLLLISHGASLLIVNNKGQTPCSMAVSHLKPETCRFMFQEEAAQLRKGGSFVNYRSTNSDGRVYGDLDPRFLEVGDPNMGDDIHVEIALFQERLKENDQIIDSIVDVDGIHLPRSLKKTTRKWREAKKNGGTRPEKENLKARDNHESKASNNDTWKQSKTSFTTLKGEEREFADLETLNLEDVLTLTVSGERRRKYTLVDNIDDIAKLRSEIIESINSMKCIGDDNESRANKDLITVEKSWGIDCEWRPSRGTGQNPVATLQLGTSQNAFVVDLQIMCQHGVIDSKAQPTNVERALSETITMLFQCKNVVKIGFGVGQDFTKLVASFPHLKCFHEINSVLDLQSSLRAAFPGTSKLSFTSLQKTVAILLGKTLDKTEQCSEWNERPLTHSQLLYASLDAAVLPALLNKMVVNNPNLVEHKGEFLSKHQHLQSCYRYLFIDDSNAAYRVQQGSIKSTLNIRFSRQSWPRHTNEPPFPEIIPLDVIKAKQNPEASEKKKVIRKSRDKSSAVLLSTLTADLDRLPSPGLSVGYTKDSCITRFLGNDLIGTLPKAFYFRFNRRGGMIEVGNAWLLFVNFGLGKIYQKYTNEFRMGGRQVTFSIEPSRSDDGTLLGNILSPDNSKNHGSKPLFFFLRASTKEKFLFCGECKYVSHTQSENMVNLLLELIEFEDMVQKPRSGKNGLTFMDIVKLHGRQHEM